MSVGENIKRIRKEKGLTQKQLGEMCGLADSAIRRYESDRANPKYETLKKISSALGVYVSDLEPDWSQIPLDDLKKDLTYQGGGFYGKEATTEMHEKFIQRITCRKTEISQKMDMLNESGQKKALDYIDDLIKIPEYKKK